MTKKKFDKTLTKTIIIVDDSASMGMVLNKTQAGLSALVESNVKTGPVHIWTFDGKPPHETVVNDLFADPQPRLKAGGSYTNLYGSVLEAIADAREEDDGPHRSKKRPGLIQTFIITDGMDNNSKQGSSALVKELISTADSRWTFSLIGEGYAAERASIAMGLKKDAVAIFKKESIEHVFKSATAASQRSVAAVARGVTAEVKYTAAERRAMAGFEVEAKGKSFIYRNDKGGKLIITKGKNGRVTFEVLRPGETSGVSPKLGKVGVEVHDLDKLSALLKCVGVG